MAAYTALQEIQKLPETDPRREAEEPAAIVRAIERPAASWTGPVNCST